MSARVSERRPCSPASNPNAIEGRIGPAFREEAMKLENVEFDWRGYFLCSAGVFEADCVDIG